MAAFFGTPIDPAAVAASSGIVHGRQLTGSVGSSSGLAPALVPAHRAELGPITASRIAANKKQQVLDERGRPARLHGAFTGGFSAGYFNTVGSAEGWAPSQFVSSKNSRADTQRYAQSIRDFMDAEDEEEILGSAVSTKGGYEGVGGAGIKRGREVAEAEATAGPAASGGAAAGTHREPLIPGGIPAELIIPVSVPIGKQLLQACGWREGQPLGPRHGMDGSAASAALSAVPHQSRHHGGTASAAASSSPSAAAGAASASASERKTADAHAEDIEAEMEAMWREATSKPGTARWGLGYDPGSLRQREDATSQLLGPGTHGAGDAAAGGGEEEGALGRRRLHMSAALTGASSTAPVYGSNSAANASKRGKGLISFQLDDAEGDDDAGVYRQPSMLEYDIPSTRVRTGADAIAEERKQKNLLLTAGPSSAGGAMSSRVHGAGSSSGGGGRHGHLSLVDAARAGAVGSSSATSSGQHPLLLTSASEAESEEARKRKKALLHADGRRPLPGFHLATRMERSYVDFCEHHRPVPPPQGWLPMHRYDTDSPQAALSALPLYQRLGAQAAAATGPTSATAASSSRSEAGASVAAGAAPAPLLFLRPGSHSTSLVAPPSGIASAAPASFAAACTTTARGGPPVPPSTNPPYVQEQEQKQRQQQQQQRSSEDLWRDRFTTGSTITAAGDGSDGLTKASRDAPSSSSALHSTAATAPVQSSSSVPRVGTRITRAETTWLPTKLLLKRFNVPDPYTKKERERIESSNAAAAAAASRGAGAAAGGGGSEPHWFAGLGLGPRNPTGNAAAPQTPAPSQAEQLRQMAGLATAFAPTSAAGAIDPAAGAELHQSHPFAGMAAPEAARVAPTLAPILQDKPAQSLFDAIFGGDDDDDD